MRMEAKNAPPVGATLRMRMESWEDVWRRRGEMLLTLGVSSGVVWATTILASPNSKVSIWPPLIIFGIVAALGAYCTFAPDLRRLPLPGRTHAATTERQANTGLPRPREGLAGACGRGFGRVYSTAEDINTTSLLTCRARHFHPP